MGIEAAVVNDWRHPALHVREQDLRCIRQPEVNAIDCPVPARPLLLRHVTSTELTLVGREILCELRGLCQVHQAARTPRIHQIPIGPLHGAIANMLGHDERQQALGLDQLMRHGSHRPHPHRLPHRCPPVSGAGHLQAPRSASHTRPSGGARPGNPRATSPGRTTLGSGPLSTAHLRSPRSHQGLSDRRGEARSSSGPPRRPHHPACRGG